MTGLRVFVPSLHRAHHVPTMGAIAGAAQLVWCVPAEEVADYYASGAQDVRVGPAAQYEKMNEVLDAFPDEWVVFSDDDCRGLLMLDAEGRTLPVTLGEAAVELVRVGNRRGDRFVCISQNQNRMFMRRTVTDWGQPSNWLCAIAPGTPERFLQRFGSEVEYAARIVANYGRIARVNHVIGMYQFGGPASSYPEYADKAPCDRDTAQRHPHLVRYDERKRKLKFIRLVK